MKSDFSKLVGTWETEDEDSRMILSISVEANGLRVTAFDKEDGEQFEVTDIDQQDEWLSFKIHVPSSGYRTRNRIRPVATDQIEQELTLIEKWKRAKTLSERAV